MSRSEAQIRADKAYYEKTKGRSKSFTATFTTEELDHIRAIMEAKQIGNADLIRRAIARLERGEEL